MAVDKDVVELQELIKSAQSNRKGAAPEQIEMQDSTAVIVPIERVRLNPRNARRARRPGHVEGIAATIKREGMLQPIAVREITWQKTTHREYEVYAGETRLLAAQMLRLPMVPVRIRNVDEVTARRLNIIENIHRDDLSDADLAQGAIDLKNEMQAQLDKWVRAALPQKVGKPLTEIQADMMLREYAEAPDWMHRALEAVKDAVRRKTKGQTPTITWEIVAAELGIDEHRLRNILPAAELDEFAKEQVASGAISDRTALVVASLKDPAQQRALTRKIVREGLTSEQARVEAQKMRGVSVSRQPAVRRVDPLENLQAANSFVAEGLGALRDNLSAPGYRRECGKALRLLRSNLEKWDRELASG